MKLESASAVASIFDRARLRLARQLRALRKSEVARLVQVTPAAITQIENGNAKPSPKVLSQLALALGFPVAFFAQDRQRTTPSTGQAFFRSLRSARQMDRDQVEAHAALLYDFSQFLERHIILPEVDFPALWVSPDATKDSIEDRAKQLRDLWGIPSGPVSSVVRLLEVHGALVTRHLMGRRELDAFSRAFDRRPVVVLGSDKGDLGRQRFDAAHELAHLVLHGDAEPGTHVTEHQAHAFAAAFLMPRDEILLDLPPRLDWKKLISLKQIWGVSIAALLFRSRDLGAITEPTYRRAMTKMNQWGWRYREPSPIAGDESPTVLPRAMALLHEQGFTETKLSEEGGYPPDLLSEIVAPETSKPRVVL